MIKEIRVDDRLIHGQVALLWPKALGISRILVANDAVSNNKVQQATLKMAAPSDIKVLMRSIADTLALFENPKAREVDMMIIVDRISDAEVLAKELSDIIARINVANTGRFDGISSSEKTNLGSTILLTEEEKESLIRLLELKDLNVVHQIAPSDKIQAMKDLVKR